MPILLLLLIVFLIGLLVGWQLGWRKAEGRIDDAEQSWKAKLDGSREQLGASRAEVKRLSAAAGACEQALAKSRTDLEECRELARKSEGSVAAPAALADLDAEPDDLKVVDGIGPKIEGLLNAGGISTWARLAGTEVSVLQSVLDKAGPRYRIHDPGTWPRQAALAASGSWDELEEQQDRLKGGRET